MGTYFAYARVSTPRQGEGVSLPEQKAAIERYAAVHGLEITRWFEERESASQTGRPVFDAMLRLLRLRKIEGVIIHKIDRSMRNPEDWADVGKLVDAGVDIHFATENVDMKTVAGRLSADIQAAVAMHYVRNLREEVKKGLYGRLKQGFYPFRAPIGYLDQGAAKAKIPDPIRAPLIQEAFKLYATGNFPLVELVREMFRCGLRSRNGGMVARTDLATILKNPFYIGLMRIMRTGQTYAGVHEPLVSTEMFERVQAVIAGKRVNRSKTHVFTYSRIVRCKTCGYSLVGERQKGHVYYRCHDRPFKDPAKCPVTSIREEQLDEAMVGLLADVDLSTDELEFARCSLRKITEEAKSNRAAARQALRLKLESVQAKLAKLTDLLIEETIEKLVFTQKQETLCLEQTRIRERLAENDKDASTTLAKLANTVELAKCASMLYKTAPLEERRELLKTLLSNLTVSGKNVEMTLSVPFQLICKRSNPSKGGPCRATCRTWEQIFAELQKYFEKHPLAM